MKDADAGFDLPADSSQLAMLSAKVEIVHSEGLRKDLPSILSEPRP